MVASDYSMARNEDGDGIGSDGLCHRSHGIRLTDAYGNVLVASGLSVSLKSATLLKSQSVAAQTAKNAIFLVWTDFLPCVG